jgi:hypothetical protein
MFAGSSDAVSDLANQAKTKTLNRLGRLAR